MKDDFDMNGDEVNDDYDGYGEEGGCETMQKGYDYP